MKKAIAGIAAALVMLTACGSDGSSEETVVEETVAESTEMRSRRHCCRCKFDRWFQHTRCCFDRWWLG